MLSLTLLTAVAALQQPVPRRALARPALQDAVTSRRAVLSLLPLPFFMDPQAALAAATGGGFVEDQFVTAGSGPPKVGELAKLTKGEPGPAELQRLVLGYKRLQYLLANWEKETTVCIKGCTGKSYEGCGCTRDPIIVQAYMGYKSMEDPLFRAGDLMLRAAPLLYEATHHFIDPCIRTAVGLKQAVACQHECDICTAKLPLQHCRRWHNGSRVHPLGELGVGVTNRPRRLHIPIYITILVDKATGCLDTP